MKAVLLIAMDIDRPETGLALGDMVQLVIDFMPDIEQASMSYRASIGAPLDGAGEIEPLTQQALEGMLLAIMRRKAGLPDEPARVVYPNSDKKAGG